LYQIIQSAQIPSDYSWINILFNCIYDNLHKLIIIGVGFIFDYLWDFYRKDFSMINCFLFGLVFPWVGWTSHCFLRWIISARGFLDHHYDCYIWSASNLYWSFSIHQFFISYLHYFEGPIISSKAELSSIFIFKTLIFIVLVWCFTTSWWSFVFSKTKYDCFFPSTTILSIWNSSTQYIPS